MTDTATKRPEILIVDDILINRILLTDILSELECRSAEAKNGEEAISMAKDRPFDMILMDIEMPIMNGVESTAAIRAHEGPNTRTPIIALTAHTEDEITEDLSSAGFTDMIGKPFLLGKIKHLIDTYCR